MQPHQTSDRKPHRLVDWGSRPRFAAPKAWLPAHLHALAFYLPPQRAQHRLGEATGRSNEQPGAATQHAAATVASQGLQPRPGSSSACCCSIRDWQELPAQLVGKGVCKGNAGAGACARHKNRVLAAVVEGCPSADAPAAARSIAAAAIAADRLIFSEVSGITGLDFKQLLFSVWHGRGAERQQQALPRTQLCAVAQEPAAIASGAARAPRLCTQLQAASILLQKLSIQASLLRCTAAASAAAVCTSVKRCVPEDCAAQKGRRCWQDDVQQDFPVNLPQVRLQAILLCFTCAAVALPSNGLPVAGGGSPSPAQGPRRCLVFSRARIYLPAHYSSIPSVCKPACSESMG
jgi:hypothetical protein